MSDNTGLLKYFKFREPSHRPNSGSSDSGILPLVLQLGQEVSLANLKIKNNKKHDRLLFSATIGWQALQGIEPDTTEVSFKIRRHNPINGDIVFETIDTAVIDFFRYTTTFFHAEKNDCKQDNKYYLTVELLTPFHPAAIIGPICFTASVIEQNND